jgi:LPXTG cell wall anchor motif
VTATADHANTSATFALTNVAADVPTTAAPTAATLPATGMTDRSRRDTDTLAFLGAGSLLLGAGFAFSSRRSRSSAGLERRST